jgi:signal transduction histidine kinase
MVQESFEPTTDPHRARGFICEETDRLDRLIASLLTFAKPQSVECVETDVAKIFDRVVDLAQTDALQHSIQLQVDVHAETPHLTADPDRLSQALYGLTLNAIQAIASTPVHDGHERRIVLRAHDADDLVRLEVCDSGPGIPEELRDQIFEPFVTSKDTGTGLGLPMALRMIEAQGGALHLQEHDLTPIDGLDGACFSVEFPAYREAA